MYRSVGLKLGEISTGAKTSEAISAESRALLVHAMELCGCSLGDC